MSNSSPTSEETQNEILISGPQHSKGISFDYREHSAHCWLVNSDHCGLDATVHLVTAPMMPYTCIKDSIFNSLLIDDGFKVRQGVICDASFEGPTGLNLMGRVIFSIPDHLVPKGFDGFLGNDLIKFASDASHRRQWWLYN